MTTPSQSPAAVPLPQPWTVDAVFSALVEPARRRLLAHLARTGGNVATNMTHISHLRLDATLKHLAMMRDAGILMTQPDKEDARRTKYSLSPFVPVVKGEDGSVALDFGCCLLRLRE